MTNNDINSKSRINFVADCTKLMQSFFLIILSLVLSLCFSETISSYTKRGLELSYGIIIPAVFPFMIISDIMLSYLKIEDISFISKPFSKLLKLSPVASNAYISGLVCGFPIGVKMSRDLYMSGNISKKECERLIGISNNPSPSFLIGGIGYSLRGNVIDGLILFISNFIASLIVGFIFSRKSHYTLEFKTAEHQSFSLTRSVKDASLNTLNTCGFVTLFSIILGILNSILDSDPWIILLSSFLEITNASMAIASANLSFRLALGLAAFAASSSGLSILLQSKSLLIGTDISIKKYFPIKLCCGLISAVTAFLFAQFI